MFIDIHIETWTESKHILNLYSTDKSPVDRLEIDAFRIFKNLINNEDGLWKDKKIKSYDGSWGAIKVSKSDIIFFINAVNNEIGKITISNMDEILSLKDNKFYALVGCES